MKNRNTAQINQHHNVIETSNATTAAVQHPYSTINKRTPVPIDGPVFETAAHYYRRENETIAPHTLRDLPTTRPAINQWIHSTNESVYRLSEALYEDKAVLCSSIWLFFVRSAEAVIGLFHLLCRPCFTAESLLTSCLAGTCGNEGLYFERNTCVFGTMYYVCKSSGRRND